VHSCCMNLSALPKGPAVSAQVFQFGLRKLAATQEKGGGCRMVK
jgi:hypothetical protein